MRVALAILTLAIAAVAASSDPAGENFSNRLDTLLAPADRVEVLEQLAALPVSADGASRIEAATVLAELRRANREKLAELGYPLEFIGRDIVELPVDEPPGRIHMTLDDSAIRGSLAALADGVVDESEARRLTARCRATAR
jgi:hypothetical protein